MRAVIDVSSLKPYLYNYTSIWQFYIIRQLIILESHVTGRAKHRVSRGMNIMSHLFGIFGTFYFKFIKSQYEHTMLTDMINSTISNHLNSLFATKIFVLYLIRMYECSENMKIYSPRKNNIWFFLGEYIFIFASSSRNKCIRLFSTEHVLNFQHVFKYISENYNDFNPNNKNVETLITRIIFDI